MRWRCEKQGNASLMTIFGGTSHIRRTNWCNISVCGHTFLVFSASWATRTGTTESCLAEIAEEGKQVADIIREAVDPNRELPCTLAELDDLRRHYNDLQWMLWRFLVLERKPISIYAERVCVRFKKKLHKLIQRVTCFANSLRPEGTLQCVYMGRINQRQLFWSSQVSD